MDEDDFELGEIEMTCPEWDTPGTCQCGAPLPPMSEWNDAGNTWATVVCVPCGWQFVTEDDHMACYPPEKPTPVRFFGGPLDGIRSLATDLTRITHVERADPGGFVHTYLADDEDCMIFRWVTPEDELAEMTPAYPSGGE